MEIFKVSFSYSLSILFIILCNTFGLNMSQEENTVCLNPKRDLNFDAKWVHDNAPPQGWYALYGNPVTRRHFAQLMQGRDLKDDDDLSKLCLKTVFDNTDKEIGGHYMGFGKLTARRKCVHDSGDKITCGTFSSANSSYVQNFKAHAAYVDTKNFRSWHIAVFCYDNGDIGWVVASIKRCLTPEDMETVLRQLKVIGFNPEDQVQLYADSCE